MTTDDLVLLIGTKEVIIAQLKTELANTVQELNKLKKEHNKVDEQT